MREDILDMYEDEGQFLDESGGASDGRESSGSHPKIPSAYAHLTWEKYQTALLRERCNAMLMCSPWQWIPWIRENADRLKRELPDEAKRSFRRMAQSSMEGCKGWAPGYPLMTMEDHIMLNEVFGPWEKPVPPAHMTGGYGYGRYVSDSDPFYGRCPTREPHGVLEYMSNTTYYWFWNWMHKEPMISSFIRKLSSDDAEYLRGFVIPTVIENNANLSPNVRSYKKGDEEEYERIISEARKGLEGETA